MVMIPKPPVICFDLRSNEPHVSKRERVNLRENLFTSSTQSTNKPANIANPLYDYQSARATSKGATRQAPKIDSYFTRPILNPNVHRYGNSIFATSSTKSSKEPQNNDVIKPNTSRRQDNYDHDKHRAMKDEIDTLRKELSAIKESAAAAAATATAATTVASDANDSEFKFDKSILELTDKEFFHKVEDQTMMELDALMDRMQFIKESIKHL